MKQLLMLNLFVLLVSSCIKPEIPSDSPCNTPILAVNFIIDISDIKNDDLFSQQYLGKFPIDSVQIYHKDSIGGVHKDIMSIEKRPDVAAGQNIYIISSNEILGQTLSGTKTFYFKRNFNITDTIIFDETNILTSEGCNNYVLHKFTYNSVPLTDTKEGYFTIIFDKP